MSNFRFLETLEPEGVDPNLTSLIVNLIKNVPISNEEILQLPKLIDHMQMNNTQRLEQGQTNAERGYWNSLRGLLKTYAQGYIVQLIGEFRQDNQQIASMFSQLNRALRVITNNTVQIRQEDNPVLVPQLPDTDDLNLRESTNLTWVDIGDALEAINNESDLSQQLKLLSLEVLKAVDIYLQETKTFNQDVEKLSKYLHLFETKIFNTTSSEEAELASRIYLFYLMGPRLQMYAKLLHLEIQLDLNSIDSHPVYAGVMRTLSAFSIDYKQFLKSESDLHDALILLTEVRHRGLPIPSQDRLVYGELTGVVKALRKKSELQRLEIMEILREWVPQNFDKCHKLLGPSERNKPTVEA